MHGAEGGDSAAVAGEDEQLLRAAAEELEQRPVSSDSDAAVEGQEDREDVEDVVTPAIEVTARAGGARPEGGRRRIRRADRRGAAEPLIRSGPSDPRTLGLVEVPDANHEALHATRWEDAIVWGSQSEDEAEPDAHSGRQPRSPEAECDDRDASLASDQTADAMAAAATGGQNGVTASMEWAFAVPGSEGRQNGAQPGPDPDDFEALLASVGIPMPGATGPLANGNPPPLLGLGSGGGARMKRYPLASNAVLELLPTPGAPQGRVTASVIVLV